MLIILSPYYIIYYKKNTLSFYSILFDVSTYELDKFKMQFLFHRYIYIYI